MSRKVFGRGLDNLSAFMYQSIRSLKAEMVHFNFVTVLQRIYVIFWISKVSFLRSLFEKRMFGKLIKKRVDICLTIGIVLGCETGHIRQFLAKLMIGLDNNLLNAQGIFKI